MDKPRITENPWFWLMLFGSLGAIGVVVIGPKHAARQARLERMAETRERINAARDAGTTAAAVRKIKPGEGTAGNTVPGGAATRAPAASPSATGATGAGATAPGTAGAVPAGADSEPTGPIEPYVDSDFLRRPQLAWLLGVMVVLMLTGTAGTILSRRRQVP